jgi:hypothetical protein
MKRTKRIKRTQHPKRAGTVQFVYDEFHTLLSSNELREAVIAAEQKYRRPGTGVVVTQAILRSNSGKRVRFLGSARRQDGCPIKPVPEKFVPAQVSRRQSAA